MAIDTHEAQAELTPLTPGWRTLSLVALFYLGCLVVATWPAFLTFGSELPSRVDPLAHLWTMRWYKACLMSGRLPFFCPEIQYPVGASLGTLPPMHFQTLLYLPLSFLLNNDPLCYNLIRTCSFLLTGLGTFLLIWNVVRSRLAATLGGMMAMIGGPMLYFSHGELEQITVGWFPLFLIAWLRWVDRPSRRGLVTVTLLYALVAMSAPYYGVFVVFPASLYVAWRAIGQGWSGIVPWLKGRAGWFAGFAGISAPIMVLLFSNQIWSLTHGQSMARPDAEFAACRAPFWGYLVPPPHYFLSKFLPFDTNVQLESGSVPSYLGLVTLGLIAYALIARVKFARRSYWYLVLAMLVILSLGAFARVGEIEVSLPAAWLKKYFVGFRMIRVPARFSLFASVAACLVAAAGLQNLLSKIPIRPARLALVGALALIALTDLSTVPYETMTIPPMPKCYDVILKQNPQATFVDVPQFNSGAFQLPSVCTYWQSFHGGKTSAGYTAFLNTRYDNLLFYNSPFDAFKLANPVYLSSPEAESFELVHGVDFRSYAWLYLKIHDLRYVVVHHKLGDFPEFPVYLGRLEELLKDTKVYEDADTTVFDRDLLPEPSQPVMLYAQGWGDRTFSPTGSICMLDRSASVIIYNPNSNQPLAFGLEVTANQKPRRVTLKSNGFELVRWTVSPNEKKVLVSPPLSSLAGFQELRIESDGEDKPSGMHLATLGLQTPFSLWATRVGIMPVKMPKNLAKQPKESETR
jgi:hypothetical protein